MKDLEVITTRRSIRDFTGEAINRKDIEAIVSAGMQAPSAHDTKTWRMLTVTDREVMKKLIPLSPWWGLLNKTGVLIAVCSEITDTAIPKLFQINGCSAAAENMLLAANALDLGGVWLGVADGEDNYCAVKEVLGIPESVELVCLLAIGVPATLPESTERYEPSKWYREKWGNTK